jgi:glutathione synthase/RimK-type ligase-like ATP-grasp enzyme
LTALIVVNNPDNWPLQIPSVRVVGAREYLTDPTYATMRGAKVFNLCRSYRYQASGYYVSLLAEARGHRPMPSLQTIQELKAPSIVRLLSEDVQDSIDACLKKLSRKQFELSIYFGKNLAARYERLALQLFNLFPAPLLRASFVHEDEDGWQLQSLSPIAASEIPDAHRPFVVEAATAYFQKRARTTRRKVPRYDLAILFNPEEKNAPSTPRAIDRFIRAADGMGIHAEVIEKDDYGALTEFDALFIRETTAVNHHTYRFSQRAQALGMVVIDDPLSILRCTNKVFLAELLLHHKIAHPETLIVYRDNLDQVGARLGFPCVLKQPDSSFSLGVKKVDDQAGLESEAKRMLEDSDLIVGQRFLRTSFDWRVGIIDRRPLYVCRYHMAPSHWQVINHARTGKESYGITETFTVAEAPESVVRTALRAANLIGDGFYGVDLKEVDGKVYVMEVNDNPNVDHGGEDKILKDELYRRIMAVFLDRLEIRSAGRLAV